MKQKPNILSIRGESGEFCQLSLWEGKIVISFHDGKTKPVYLTPEQLKYIFNDFVKNNNVNDTLNVNL